MPVTDLWISNIFINLSALNSLKLININCLVDTAIHIFGFQRRWW